MILDYYYSTLSKQSLAPSKTELAHRLGMKPQDDFSFADKACKEVLDLCSAKYSAIRTDVRYSNGFIDLGFCKIKSRDLERNLKGADEAFVCAVTLGAKVDMLLKQKQALSASEAFVTDSAASAIAEKAADLMQSEFENDFRLRPRFSPGYGDMPLTNQSDILAATNASKLLGIKLGKDLLMSPMKSITCIIGIVK